jgi:hypothetical protein
MAYDWHKSCGITQANSTRWISVPVGGVVVLVFFSPPVLEKSPYNFETFFILFFYKLDLLLLFNLFTFYLFILFWYTRIWMFGFPSQSHTTLNKPRAGCDYDIRNLFLWRMNSCKRTAYSWCCTTVTIWVLSGLAPAMTRDLRCKNLLSFVLHVLFPWLLFSLSITK